MSGYGFAIVLICLAGGLALALTVNFLITDSRWRRASFFAGIAIAFVYVVAQPMGYDRWDAYVAAWYGGGAVAGWIVGFVAGARSRARRRATRLTRHE